MGLSPLLDKQPEKGVAGSPVRETPRNTHIWMYVEQGTNITAKRLEGQTWVGLLHRARATVFEKQ